ncbi:hypothetical protein TNCV_2701081 [Trichonephila clavipes]|nr:hypothetical protein TNCV_2701081 [Trichonephila clavipes]
MKEGLISSRYECPKCKKGMRLAERKGTIDGFEWRCRVVERESPLCLPECKKRFSGILGSESVIRPDLSGNTGLLAPSLLYLSCFDEVDTKNICDRPLPI